MVTGNISGSRNSLPPYWGIYTYEATFDLTGFDTTTVRMDIKMDCAYELGTELSLNGVRIWTGSASRGSVRAGVRSTGLDSITIRTGRPDSVNTESRSVGFIQGINRWTFKCGRLRATTISATASPLPP
jgi:hypothetical protein